MLGRDGFGLIPAEFGAQTDFAVEEAFPDPSGRVQYRLSPMLDQSAWPTNLSMESAPVINMTRKQEAGFVYENLKTKYVSSTDLTGSMYFPSVFVKKRPRIHGSQAWAAETRGSRASRLLQRHQRMGAAHRCFRHLGCRADPTVPRMNTYSATTP